MDYADSIEGLVIGISSEQIIINTFRCDHTAISNAPRTLFGIFSKNCTYLLNTACSKLNKCNFVAYCFIVFLWR